jgi:hypothetical protein
VIFYKEAPQSTIQELSYKHLSYRASSRPACKNPLEDFTGILSRSSHKGLYKMFVKKPT